MTRVGGQRPTSGMSDNKLINSLIAGSISGSVSTILFQPFDLIKTRLQNNVSSCSGASCTSSSLVKADTRMSSLIVTIIKRESLIGLWKGTSAGLIRTVPGVGLYFMTLDVLKTNFSVTSQVNGHDIEGSKKKSVSKSAVESLAFGAIARTFVGVILLPATVLKTRFESGMYQYQSLSHAVNSSIKMNGIKSLYSGLWPTLMRDVPYSSLYFMFYTILKDHLIPPRSTLEGVKSKSDADVKSASIFAIAIVSGILASSITHPFDVIKTRMQLTSDKKDDCDKIKVRRLVATIFEKNGFKGFLVGLTPRILRRSLMAGLAWTVFERAKAGST